MAKPSIVPVDEERRMTVIEHLEELRRVLIISLIAWALATVIGFATSQVVLGILLGPVHKVIGDQKLIYPGPVDAFLLFFKIGIFTGFVSTQFLKRKRLKFWIGIFVGANMVTPGVDPFTPLLLTAPLIILFELSILVIRALRR